MPHEKWSNLSQEFLQTTKMINLSLNRVSCNELTDIVNQIPEEDDCVSIEDELEVEGRPREEGECQFEDPALFFASKFSLGFQ